MATTDTSPPPRARGGMLAALGAYGVWGGFPLLFRQLDGVNPVLVVAHRVVWSLVFVGAILASRRRLGEVAAALRDRRAVLMLLLSAALLSGNWLLFVWAVEAERVLEVSFGYFINPLVSVAIGMALLGERQNRIQVVAIGIALVAVAIQAAGIGTLPWVSLTLALSFGFYGYCRKTVNVGSAAGLFVETLLLLPFALLFLGWWTATHGFWPHDDGRLMAFLALTGPATAAALLMFAFAARRLRLTTLGMFQYLAPSLHFATAVWLFGEPLSGGQLLSFVLIWISLAVFSLDGWRRHRGVAAGAP